MSKVGAARINMLRVFEWVRLQAGWSVVPLRSVSLRQPLVNADAVIDVRVLRARHVAAGARLVEKLAALSHEIGMVDRMLRNPMRGFRAFNADQTLGGPTDPFDNCAQARGIRIVHGGHSRVIALKQRSIGGEFGADSLIVLVHLNQFSSEGGIHRLCPVAPCHEKDSDAKSEK